MLFILYCRVIFSNKGVYAIPIQSREKLGRFIVNYEYMLLIRTTLTWSRSVTASPSSTTRSSSRRPTPPSTFKLRASMFTGIKDAGYHFILFSCPPLCTKLYPSLFITVQCIFYLFSVILPSWPSSDGWWLPQTVTSSRGSTTSRNATEVWHWLTTTLDYIYVG